MGAILDMEPSRSQTKADQITKAGFSVRKVQAAWWRERSVSERTLHFSLTSLALFEALLLFPNLCSWLSVGHSRDMATCSTKTVHTVGPRTLVVFFSPPNFGSGKGRGYFGFDGALAALLLAPELSRTLEYLSKPELASSTDPESSGSCLWQ